MGGSSKLAVLLAVVALATGLLTCGSGDDSTQSSDSTGAVKEDGKWMLGATPSEFP